MHTSQADMALGSNWLGSATLDLNVRDAKTSPKSSQSFKESLAEV